MAALAPARPLVARVDISQNSEEIAADILDIWNAVEVALRALLGGSALGGQPLVQELRQRNMISIDQAHALLDFLAARDRVKRTEYRPTSADVTATRDAYNKLDQGLRAEAATAGASTTATQRAAPRAAPPVRLLHASSAARVARAFRGFPIVALLLVLGAAGGAWYFFEGGGPSAAMRRGMEAYRGGRLAQARIELAGRGDCSTGRSHAAHLGSAASHAIRAITRPLAVSSRARCSSTRAATRRTVSWAATS